MAQDVGQGVQDFMRRVSGYLQATAQAKSELYDIDFPTGIPFSKPKRFQWEPVSEGERESLASLPSLSTTGSPFDLPDLLIADEGEVQEPPETVLTCNKPTN